MKLVKATKGLSTERLKDEALAALVQTAQEFYAAGGVLHLDDWIDLDHDERTAFLIAAATITTKSEEEKKTETAKLHTSAETRAAILAEVIGKHGE